MAWFCPMENAWGTWADWATVVTGVAGTIAVGTLALRANAIAHASREAAAADSIRAQQERQRESNVLLMYIAAEMDALQVHLNVLKRMFHAPDTMWTIKAFMSITRTRELIYDQAQRLRFPNVEKVMSRLHVMQPEVGLRISRLISSLNDIQAFTRDASIHPSEPADAIDGGVTYLQICYQNLSAMTLGAVEDLTKIRFVCSESRRLVD